MALILHDITCSLSEGYASAGGKALLALGLPPDTKAEPSRVSIDARGGKIRFVASVAVHIDEKAAAAIKAAHPAKKITLKYHKPLRLILGEKPLNTRPVVVGFGPAGMFAALALAEAGYRPIVIDRGQDIDRRQADVARFWSTGKLDSESNVQFGEGGAGAFSDGKLTTRIGDSRCDFVLEQFARFGAPADILIKAKPHVGTDNLKTVVRRLRERVIELGGEVRFGLRLTGFTQRRGELTGIITDMEEIPATAAILAIGHSARDSFFALSGAGMALTPKPFSVGVRIEHLQADIDRALYGPQAGNPALWPGEYQLSHREGSEACYTFCMCPGGQVVAAASGAGQLVTNGMSHYARALPNANSALVVAVNPAGDSGDWRLNLSYQQTLEERAMAHGGGPAPAQSAGLFLAGRGGIKPGRVRPTYPHGVTECSFDALFDQDITKMLRRALPVFGRRLRGFDSEDAILTGVESRTSSPLRMPRGEDLTADGIDGLYPCGEGAGYAGGIMSAAVDGLRAAEALSARYAPYI